MMKHDIPAFSQTRFHLCQQALILNIIRPIEILQVQMSRIPLPHSLGFQHKTLCLCIHKIQHRLLIVKSGREGTVQIIIDIFHIERGCFLAIAYDRALHRICPCPHIIYIGLGNGQAIHCPAGRKIKFFSRKYCSVIGDPF